MINSVCYSTVDLVRQARLEDPLWRPLDRVREDSELAFASLLGLRSGTGARVSGTHPLGAAVVFGLLIGLALVLGLIGLGGALQ